MRRQDREITDRDQIDAIIRACPVCHLGLVDDGQPYVVPVSFGYDGRHVFFHSSTLGRKIDILQRNNRVCVEFEINDGLITGPQACDWTTAYRSVIGVGTAELVADPAEKREGLAVLMAQYADGPFTFGDQMVQRTAVVRVTLESVTGKQRPKA